MNEHLAQENIGTSELVMQIHMVLFWVYIIRPGIYHIQIMEIGFPQSFPFHSSSHLAPEFLMPKYHAERTSFGSKEKISAFVIHMTATFLPWGYSIERRTSTPRSR